MHVIGNGEFFWRWEVQLVLCGRPPVSSVEMMVGSVSISVSQRLSQRLGDKNSTLLMIWRDFTSIGCATLRTCTVQLSLVTYCSVGPIVVQDRIVDVVSQINCRDVRKILRRSRCDCAAKANRQTPGVSGIGRNGRMEGAVGR